MEVDLDRLCHDLSTGATLAEACRVQGVSYPSLRRAVCLGQKTKAGKCKEIRARVMAAQAAWDGEVRGIVLKAARKGVPKALEEVLRRAERSRVDVEAEEPPTDRSSFLRWRLTHIRRWIAEESGIARTKLLEEERSITAEIEAVEDAIRKEKLATQDTSARLTAFRTELQSLPRAMRLQIRAIVLEEVEDET